MFIAPLFISEGYFSSESHSEELGFGPNIPSANS